jgi:hypothetical protein
MSSTFGLDVSFVTQVQQCPKIPIADEDDVPTTTAIAAIRTTFGDVFFSSEVS